MALIVIFCKINNNNNKNTILLLKSMNLNISKLFKKANLEILCNINDVMYNKLQQKRNIC